MKTEPIYVFAKWQVQTGRLDEVLGLLQEVAAQSTLEPGNLFYKIHQSTADENTFLLYEAYQDEPALAAHSDTEHFKSLVLGKIIPLLDHREVVLSRSIHAN